MNKKVNKRKHKSSIVYLKKEYLEDGEELIISPEVKKFLYGCCECGMIHTIKVSRKNGNIVLRFYKYER